MDVALASSGEERAMPTTFTQRCARHLPFQRAISMTAGGACRAAIARMVQARVEDGDIITPRIAYRGVPTGALPVRPSASTSPTRAFDRSAGPVASRLPDAEHCGSHASLNHPSPEGHGAIPSEGGGSCQEAPCRVPGVAAEDAVAGAGNGLAGSLHSRAASVAWRHRNGRSGTTTLSVGCRVGGLIVFCAPSPGGHIFFLRWRNEKGATCAAPR